MKALICSLQSPHSWKKRWSLIQWRRHHFYWKNYRPHPILQQNKGAIHNRPKFKTMSRKREWVFHVSCSQRSSENGNWKTEARCLARDDERMPPRIDANRKLEDTPHRVSLSHPKPCTLYGHDYKILQFSNPYSLHISITYYCYHLAALYLLSIPDSVRPTYYRESNPLTLATVETIA